MGGSLGGITDTFNRVLDPLDIFGGQAKRQKKAADNDAKNQLGVSTALGRAQQEKISDDLPKTGKIQL